jgi:hypothetical protein
MLCFVFQFWFSFNDSRVPLTGGRLTGQPDIRPFFCSVIKSSDDPLAVQKGRLSGHLITVHYGWISRHQNDSLSGQNGRLLKHLGVLTQYPNKMDSYQVIFVPR